MNMKLMCAINELTFLQLELDSLEDTITDPSVDAIMRYACSLRVKILEMGKVMLQSMILHELAAANIEDILPMTNMVHEIKK